MQKLSLIPPKAAMEAQFWDCVNDFREAGEAPKPWGLTFGGLNTMAEIMEAAARYERGEDLPQYYVKTTVYWLVLADGSLAGAVNIRHKLNEELYKTGGHIGYGVRPRERNKGYATEMLRLALIECQKLRIGTALVTCNRDNAASARVIMKNGGVYENSFLEDNGNLVDRYLIRIG